MTILSQLKVETWLWYSLGILIVCVRIGSRAVQGGILRLNAEDYMMLVATMFYTLSAVFNVKTSQAFNVGVYSTSGLNDLSLDNISAYAAGSKYVLIAEQGSINTLYILKCCILMLFSRLTFGRRILIAVYILGAYVVLGWIATQLAFFLLTCVPFSGNWASPPPNAQCVSWGHYSTVQGLFNISSDLGMLVIPIILFARTQYPIKQKIYLCSVFSMGVFVIVCAILDKVYLNDPSWQFWNIRQTSVAIYVSNIPVLVSLARSLLGSRRKSQPDHVPTTNNAQTQPKSIDQIPEDMSLGTV